MAKLPALPYVRASVTQGVPPSQAYAQYQLTAHESGLTGMRKQDFLRLYSQTVALRGHAALAMNYPKDQPPEQTIPRNTVRARGYGQWVAIYQRTSNGSDFFHTPYLVKSSRPLTPAEAEAEALGYLELQPDEYDRVTLGVGYMGTEQFIPQASQ